MAEHTHDHSHSHDHDHEGGDSYFIDQLCMVGLSGAFGVVCLCLWFWEPAPPAKKGMLGLMLGEQFHLYVLLSGIVLTALSLMRGAILWRQSRDPAFLKKHDHAHGDDCGHSHAPGETCDHEHHVGDAHAHHHGHGDHDEADHDHGWAPWRYVVLLVPVILFLLGLPDKPPTVKARDLDISLTTLPELACFGVAYDLAESLNATSAKAAGVDFKFLEAMASKPDLRDHWKNKLVEVRGQFAPVRGNDKVFMLVKFKISCCANDAVQLDVPMISRVSLAGLKDPDTGAEIKHGDWVKVTGRVEFRKRGGSEMTVLIISKAADIKKCDPDANPYIQ
jgi:hypothetical protein